MREELRFVLDSFQCICFWVFEKLVYTIYSILYLHSLIFFLSFNDSRVGSEVSLS